MIQNNLCDKEQDLFDKEHLPLSVKYDSCGRKKRVIVIAGPTAVGKTNLSIDIAKILDGEIISSDSMQVYKEMDIGSAKPTIDQRNEVSHHLVDIRDISQTFNVAEFYYEAHRACREIILKGKVPIVVGGSGFYLHTFLYGPPLGPPSDGEIRKRLEMQLKTIGSSALYERLQMLDPEYAQTITEHDKHKIVRALEIIAITQKKVSEIPKPKKLQDDDYNFRCWFLYMPKEILYQKVDRRCDEMIVNGFIEEVERLEEKGFRGNFSASQAIGYRQCLEYLLTNQTEEDMLEFIRVFKKASRHYVKRQFTWFKKEPFFRWLDIYDLGIERVKEFICQDYEQG